MNAVIIVPRRKGLVQVKVSFFSFGESMAGTFQGKLKPVCDMAGKVLSSSIQVGVAVCMINRGGVIGVVSVACIAALKLCFDAAEA